MVLCIMESLAAKLAAREHLPFSNESIFSLLQRFDRVLVSKSHPEPINSKVVVVTNGHTISFN